MHRADGSGRFRDSGAEAASSPLGSLARALAFERGRTSITLLLDAIAETLPATASLVSFRADANGVTTELSANRAADVVQALERIPRMSGIEIAGPVIRDAAGSGGQERVTLHFRGGPDPSDARAAIAGSRVLRSAVIMTHSHAASVTSLAAIVNDVAERTGVRIGTLRLGTDSSQSGGVIVSTLRGDAVGDVSGLAHFVARLESGTPILAVRELALTPTAIVPTVNDPSLPMSGSASLRAEFVVEALAMVQPRGTRQ